LTQKSNFGSEAALRFFEQLHPISLVEPDVEESVWVFWSASGYSEPLLIRCTQRHERANRDFPSLHDKSRQGGKFIYDRTPLIIGLLKASHTNSAFATELTARWGVGGTETNFRRYLP